MRFPGVDSLMATMGLCSSLSVPAVVVKLDGEDGVMSKRTPTGARTDVRPPLG